MDAKEDVSAIALEMLHEEIMQQKELLIGLEARPILDMDGLTRRLEELTDAVERATRPPPPVPQRPWWLTPGLMMLAVLVGVLLGWELLRWRPVQVLLFPPQAPHAAPQTQKGKK